MYGMADADDADYLSRRHGKGPVLGYDVRVGHGAVIMAGEILSSVT